jgi:hypothetical protein
MAQGAKRASVRLYSGRHWGGQRDQLCQLSEVLGGGGEEELVVSTARPSQPKPIEAENALEVCEQTFGTDILSSASSICCNLAEDA